MEYCHKSHCHFHYILERSENASWMQNFKKYIKKEKTPIQNICFNVIGQLRSFHTEKVFLSFLDVVNILRKKYNVVCLFYICDSSQKYNYVDYINIWGLQQQLSNNNTSDINTVVSNSQKKDKYYDKQNENIKITDILETANIDYEINYYSQTMCEEFKDNIFHLRDKLISESYKFMLKYEDAHGIKFDYIIQTRPDLQYNLESFDNYFNNINSNLVFNSLDLFNSYPKNLYQYCLENEDKIKELTTADTKIINYLLNNTPEENQDQTFWYMCHFTKSALLLLSGANNHGYQFRYGFTNTDKNEDTDVKNNSEFFCAIIV